MDPFYLRSFSDLSTERRYEMGAIPWSCIRDYGFHVGLYDDIIDSFVSIIRALDSAYLKWSADEIDRQRKQRQKT